MLVSVECTVLAKDFSEILFHATRGPGATVTQRDHLSTFVCECHLVTKSVEELDTLIRNYICNMNLV